MALLVNDNTPRVQYVATASQTVFAYPFAIFVNADLKVYQTLAGADANDTTDILTLTTDYTVSGASTTDGGNVTLVTGASAGDIITIERDLAMERTTDYQNLGDLESSSLNTDLDRLVMMTQQNESDILRTFNVHKSNSSITDFSLAPDGGKVLAWKTDESGLEALLPAVGSIGDGVTTSSKLVAAALTLTSEDAGKKVFVTSADGGEFTVRYNATPATYADNGGAYCGTEFIPTGGDGTIGFVRDSFEEVLPEWFGATGLGTGDDSSATQLAIDSGFDVAILNDYELNGTALTSGAVGQRIVGRGGSILGASITLTHEESEVIGVTFDTILDRAVRIQASYAKVNYNKFKSIGSGFISGTSSTADYAVVHIDGAAASRGGVEIKGNLFKGIKGDSCIRIDGNPNQFDIALNSFISTRFYAVKIGTSSPGQIGAIDNNRYYQIGFNYDAGDTGIAGTAIYAPDEQPLVSAVNNRILTTSENGIEGGFGLIDNNLISGAGTDPSSGTYSTASRFSISTVYGGDISNNRCSNAGSREISVLTTSDNVQGQNVTDNILKPLTANKGLYVSISSTGEANECNYSGNRTIGGDGDFLLCTSGDKNIWKNNSGYLTASGTVKGWDWMENKSLRKTANKSVTDATATDLFRISTTDETTNDGGTWSAILTCHIANNSSPSASSGAVKIARFAFCRAMDSAGTGGLSAVTEVFETGSAASSAPARDIGTVTVTTTENSEFTTDVEINVDGTGGSAAILTVIADLQVFFFDFTSEGSITEL